MLTKLPATSFARRLLAPLRQNKGSGICQRIWLRRLWTKRLCFAESVVDRRAFNQIIRRKMSVGEINQAALKATKTPSDVRHRKKRKVKENDALKFQSVSSASLEVHCGPTLRCIQTPGRHMDVDSFRYGLLGKRADL